MESAYIDREILSFLQLDDPFLGAVDPDTVMGDCCPECGRELLYFEDYGTCQDCLAES